MIKAISGVGALGLTYHSCPYWNRQIGNPQLHISLWFVKLLVSLPWKDITPYGHGTYTSSYGFFWWPSLTLKVRFLWDHKNG